MSKRSPWNRRFLILLVGLFAGACFSYEEPPHSRVPRLLDRICDGAEPEECMVEGSARRVTGITQDAVGFRLGPGTGKVFLPLRTWSSSVVLEFMLAGKGHVLLGPQEGPYTRYELTKEYAWTRISFGNDSNDKKLVYIVIEVEDDGSEARLADIRGDGIDGGGGCSVAYPGASKRPRFWRSW